tara:strand:+ start:492 stop:1052 length:561 start_codon:yes stop_codon:yes gene_type:complete
MGTSNSTNFTYKSSYVLLTDKKKHMISIRQHRYYTKNKSRINEATKLWARQNKEKLVGYRAKRKGTPEDEQSRIKAREKFKTVSIKKYLLSNCKRSAKKANRDFAIKEQDIVIPTHCPLLGIKITVHGDRDNRPSVDRINNSKGYTKDNIQIVSWRANRLKQAFSAQELYLCGKSLLSIEEGKNGY